MYHVLIFIYRAFDFIPADDPFILHPGCPTGAFPRGGAHGRIPGYLERRRPFCCPVHRPCGAKGQLKGTGSGFRPAARDHQG